jgi:predicted phosphodiesterase
MNKSVWRFDRQQFEGIDLILSCGDLPPEYLSFLLGKLNVPLFFVLGNHDIRYESKSPHGCIDLNANLIKFRGINIFGLEGSRWYNGGPHQYTEREMYWKIQRLRPRIWRMGGVDIIIDAIEVLKVFDGLLINIRRVILYMATSTPILQTPHSA